MNLQLGFVFVVLNLFGEKRKKISMPVDDDHGRGEAGVKLSVHVLFSVCYHFDCR